MKDITLKITGKLCFDDEEQDQMEFVTDGKLYVRGKNTYVVYEESELSGMAGCRTTLRMNDNSVRMKRIGDIMTAELYFEQGKRFNSVYQTPYGPMGVEILTNYVRNQLDPEDNLGQVDIGYDVSMEGMAEGKNHLTIKLM